MSLKVVRSLCFCSFLDLILFASLAITVQAQSVNSQGTNSEPPPPRNADAVKVLEMAYQAMGGAQGLTLTANNDIPSLMKAKRLSCRARTAIFQNRTLIAPCS